MRYVSAERAIAAAGAAFACPEDDSLTLVKAPTPGLMSRMGRSVRNAVWRAMLVTGLVIA